jgi:anti-anti-sigma factor
VAVGLEVTFRKVPPVVVAGLSGELDMASAPALEEALAEARRDGMGQLVLDLRELRFIDSSGLRAVIAAAREARRSGHDLALIRGPDQVQQVFDITGVGRRMTIVSDESEVVPVS